MNLPIEIRKQKIWNIEWPTEFILVEIIVSFLSVWMKKDMHIKCLLRLYYQPRLINTHKCVSDDVSDAKGHTRSGEFSTAWSIIINLFIKLKQYQCWPCPSNKYVSQIFHMYTYVNWMQFKGAVCRIKHIPERTGQKIRLYIYNILK